MKDIVAFAYEDVLELKACSTIMRKDLASETAPGIQKGDQIILRLQNHPVEEKEDTRILLERSSVDSAAGN